MQGSSQFGIASNWLFSFCLERAAPIGVGQRPHRFSKHSMIVCSCNVLTDHDVRNVVSQPGNFPRTAGQVYGCLGCSAECGRCARTIKKIMDEALGSCAKACCSGCPHSQPSDATEEQHEPVVLLAQAAC